MNQQNTNSLIEIEDRLIFVGGLGVKGLAEEGEVTQKYSLVATK